MFLDYFFSLITNLKCNALFLGPLRRYLVDLASSHMLVSKIKPCMSKNRDHSQIREWLITTALVYWIYKSYMDTCGNSRANTRKKALTLRKGRIY